jgi:hypothetical protein
MREASYGLLSAVQAVLIAYPFSMKHAHRAASFVARRLSHEAIIATFAGRIVVISVSGTAVAGIPCDRDDRAFAKTAIPALRP